MELASGFLVCAGCWVIVLELVGEFGCCDYIVLLTGFLVLRLAVVCTFAVVDFVFVLRLLLGDW